MVPEVTLRPQQYEALSAVWTELYDKDHRVCFLEAPTGVGKSIVELALCRYAASISGDDSYIVTPQRVLQDQMRGWNGLRIMKGKGSYPCTLVQSTSAANAPCNVTPAVREEHTECRVGNCPYFTALEAAKSAQTVVHNYASLMAQAHIGKHFGPRGLMCLDEGHTAVNWIRNYMSCEFEPNDLLAVTSEKAPRPKMFVPWLRWTMADMDELPRNLPDNMAATLMKIFAHRQAFGIIDEDTLKRQWIEEGPTKYSSYEAFAKHSLIDSGLVPWHTQWHEPDRWHVEGRWSTIPLRVAPMAGTLIDMGRKVLIVSATILNKPLMSVELGLRGENPSMVTIESAFPVENRPIVRRYAGKMSYRHRRKTTPKVIAELERIASKHSDEPGMIHTVSHALSRVIARELQARLGGRIVEQLPRGHDRERVIHRFLSGALGPNAILVGPSLMEGVDGKDGSCRWQAMVKAPWPHMKDPVVERLMKSSRPKTRKWARKWYMWKAAQQTVQGIGRVCRTPSDYGVTYVLDSDYERILSSGYIPRYIKDAIN